MGAGGQWVAGEGVADGAHGFRVLKVWRGLRSYEKIIELMLFSEPKF
jgi:hypothetical protein